MSPRWVLTVAPGSDHADAGEHEKRYDGGCEFPGSGLRAVCTEGDVGEHTRDYSDGGSEQVRAEPDGSQCSGSINYGEWDNRDEPRQKDRRDTVLSDEGIEAVNVVPRQPGHAPRRRGVANGRPKTTPRRLAVRPP